MNINDLTFEPKASEETIDAAAKWLDANKKNFSHACAFVIVGDEAKKLAPTLNGHCHAAIQTAGAAFNNGTRAVVGTEIAIARNAREDNPIRPKGEEIYPFLRWMLYDSPFGRFIINRDNWDFIIDKGIVVSADCPAPVLQNIMIMTRHIRECYKPAFKMFNEMIEKYPKAGMLLFNTIFCSSISSMLPASEQDDPHVYTCTAHRICGLYPTMEELNNFCAGDWGETLTNDTNIHYRHHATIYGGTKYARKLVRGQVATDSYSTFIHDLLLIDDDFKKELQKLRKNENASPIIKNPFARPAFGTPASPNSPAICRVSEVRELVIPYIIEKGLIPSVL